MSETKADAAPDCDKQGNEPCSCQKIMGNDFYFLPIDNCLKKPTPQLTASPTATYT